MGITKELLLKLGLDDKKAEAVLKKFREEAEKPAKMELNIDIVSLDNAMVALNKFFTQLQKGLGKEKGFEVLSQSLIKVSENIEKVINASKEMTAINVNPLGLDEATKQIREIADTLRDMAKIKPEGNFFTNVEGHLREIQVLVNSIMEGLNFDKIRPSKMVEQEIAKAKSALKKIEDPNRTKTSIEKYFALNDDGRNQKAIPKIGKSIVADNESVQGVVSNGETEKLKALLSYMKDYVKLGGQLKDLQAGIKGVNLEDVFNKLRVDETLGSDVGIKNAVKELQYYLDLQAKIPKLQEELQVAQARENRDITATFDTKSVESFAAAIEAAVSKIDKMNLSIPEGTQIAAGFSEEQLKGFIQNLDTISSKLEEIHKLMQNAFDITKLQAEINEGINKTPIKVDVEPELTDPVGFVNEIEKQLAGHKVKLGIDLTDAQDEQSGKQNKNPKKIVNGKSKQKTKEYDIEKLRKDLSSSLKDSSLSDLGEITNVTVQKNGSAIVKFLKTVEGQAETTAIKIKDVEAALLKLSSGNLAKSVDYEVLASGEKKTKTTSSSATKIDTRQFKAGFEAKVKSLTTGVDKLSIEETQDLAVYEQALQKISNLLGQVSADTSKATEEQKQYIAALKEASNAMVQKVSTDYTKFSDNSGNKIGAYQKLLDDYREKMSSLRTLVTSEGFSFSNEEDIRNFSEILLQIKNINTELSDNKKYTAASSTEIERFSKQLQNWKAKNSKAMTNSDFSKQFKAIENGLKPGIAISDLEKLRSEFYKLDASVSKAGKTGKSFFESWKDRAKGLVSYLTTFASFYDVINILREGVQVVRELDGAFVEMQKVSNDSLSSLKEYAKESFALGDSVGTTGKQMQESAADWMGEILVPLYGNI